MARVLILAFVVLMSAEVASSQNRGRGAANRPDSGSGTSGTSVSISVFTREHAVIIREWFSQPGNLQGLPPGLAKKEQLPPGLQRQLQKNGKLPPGLEKKLHTFPVALESRLPRIREGYVRVVIGQNAVVMEVATKTIVDILTDIF